MKEEIIIHKVNLQDEERALYSLKLQEFEAQFSYPLGDKRFNIVHGKGKGQDYFSFFEQMGEVYYFVAKVKENIVGAGCAILRDSEEGKYWYLCDFKIAVEYRKKGILEKMLRQNFIHCIKKSRKMIAVNMGNGKKQGNGLFSKIRKMLWMFRIKVETLNFHTWTTNNMPNGYYISSNKGKKDLLIDGDDIPLYHITRDEKKEFANFRKFELSENSQVMACVNQKEDYFDEESISGHGIIISIGFKKPLVSTVEI